MSKLDPIVENIEAVKSIKAIPTILDIICRTTGMRFAAVARVTEDRWVACSVRDDIEFGLKPGGELELTTTICHEIRQRGEAVIIDHVNTDIAYRDHLTPKLYGFQSYLSMPIVLEDGTFFGTLCAIDPAPHELNTPENIAMLQMFADVIGFHLSAIDRISISEAKLSEERVNAAFREQFIAVLGHDLRNPLAAISAGAELLMRTPLNEKAGRVTHMILGSAARMAGLIENIMDFARGRLGGGLSLDRSPHQKLDEILLQVVTELQTKWPDRDIDAKLAIPASINCDARRLAQLLSNLLGNALTYGAPDQSIRVIAKTTETSFELSVSNGGAPISPAVLARIFQPFARGDVSAHREGLGLGLYIAQEIARAHGGELSAISIPSQTSFVFKMPLGTSPLPARGHIILVP